MTIQQSGHHNNSTRRDQAASLHMDAMRGIAALAVFFSHLRALFFVDYEQSASKGIAIKLLYMLTGLGHEAVVVFFVLSGFLVGGSVLKAEARGKWSWSQYGFNRLTRLYTVLIPALLLGACWDTLGIHLFGYQGVYGGSTEYRLIIPVPVAQTATISIGLGNLAFLQGILVRPFGSNGPLWSLSYEFWYYLLFPCFWLAWLPNRAIHERAMYLLLGMLIVCFVGKMIVSYFAIWLMGAALNVLHRLRNKPGLPAMVTAVSLLIGTLLISRLRFLPPGIEIDCLIGLAFALVLWIVINLQEHAVPDWYQRSATTLSGISYTLYLVHVPILVFLNGLLLRSELRWQLDLFHGTNIIAILAVSALYTWIVWRLTEANTGAIRDCLVPYIKGLSQLPEKSLRS